MFVPSILTILGVIMYLRLGWVVGNVGLFSTLLIVTISTSITLLTALSMSATATNMKVGVGGAYYMISRSFGVEAGAAVGLPLFLAQALGISFYVAGFSEALHSVFPFIPEKVSGVTSLVGIALLAYFSANAALKTQMVVLTLIILSLISFGLGGPPETAFVLEGEEIPRVGFWVAFAVFFPAVTGIEAGMALSGDLKNPARALPWGTLGAVLVGYLVYMALPFYLVELAPPEVLRGQSDLMVTTAWVGELVILGIWAATLSSALGAMLGAPRTLQALAQDRVVPSFLGRGGENPRVATVCSFAVALAGVLLGDLNVIAPLLSMFFLTSYGFLNLSAFVGGLLSNPSWRPTFRTPWFLSLLGTLGCFMVMLMINPGATFLAGILCSIVFLVTAKRNLNARWTDVRRSIMAYLAKKSIYQLRYYKKNSHSWRPNILVMAGSIDRRWYLVELANAITHNQGFLTVAMVVSRDATPDHVEKLEASAKAHLDKVGVAALTKVTFGADPFEGARLLLENYGLGDLTPNTILLGESEKPERFEQYCQLLRSVRAERKNLVIVREPARTENKRKRIDVWWGGQNQNAGLMLALAYLLQTSPEWAGSKLSLRTTVADEKDLENNRQGLLDFIREIRVRADAHVYVCKERSLGILRTTIKEESQDADLVFIGMRSPEEDESDAAYAEYYRELLEATTDFPQTAIVSANEPVSFKDIFS